ncbi:pseudouridine synthase [Brevibacillus brevis NBRC 100599]|uniref:Pseudouridine synthase n=1 Tax=Brevibacillus brevis (strain 47 / JCM 6285 / NBRC 100599) TaxID=358681 RepID=C0ZCK6_BREBN|nr:RluA family pseudouridine synthase [Brevibacillus brevis]BAH43515.1 pseudouridine synthase [Brevibacillus brevis NBRC 100599]
MLYMKKEGEWLVALLRDKDDAIPIGNLLREEWKLPRKQVHLLFQHKEVLLDGEPVAQHVVGKAGQEIRLRMCKPEALGLDPASEAPEILYEDDHLLIVNKPVGLLLHPTERYHHVTLDHLVSGHFFRTGLEAKVRHVHRLDQDTSGVVLYAKHPWASALLDEMLRERTIKRTYVAYVSGQMPKERGKINEPIGKDRNHGTRRRVTPNGDPAITHYQVKERFQTATKVECQLETGRTHQIRVHFSHIGHPLLGDELYGGKRELIKRQALHAAVLKFEHPFGGEVIEVTAPLPLDLFHLEKKLR